MNFENYNMIPAAQISEKRFWSLFRSPHIPTANLPLAQRLAGRGGTARLLCRRRSPPPRCLIDTA